MDPITTHVEDAKARVLSQYSDDDVLLDIIEVLSDRTQTIENKLDTFKLRLSLEDAVGVQLDNVGKLVGLKRRSGQDDATYKTWIEFRIIELMSEGTMNELIFVFKFMMGASTVLFTPLYPAHFLINTPNPNPVVSFSEVRQALEGAKAGGVGYDIIIYVTNPFTFFNDPEGAGFSGIEVDDGGNLAGIF